MHLLTPIFQIDLCSGLGIAGLRFKVGQYKCHVKFEHRLLRNKFTNAAEDMYLKGERVVDSYTEKFDLANVI